MTNTRIEQLTGLRFIAALGVLLSHFSILLPPDNLKFLWVLGGNGVVLFFVLSGFVLTLRYDDVVNNSHIDMKKYVVARFARIIPIYWLSLILTAIVYFFSDGVYSLGSKTDSSIQIVLSFFLNVAALQAWFPSEHIQQYWNAPGWSISAEIFFYSCFPWFLKIRFLNGSIRSFVLILLVFVLVNIFYSFVVFFVIPVDYRELGILFAARLPIFGLFSFLIGMLCCRLMRMVSIEKRKNDLVLYLIFVVIVINSFFVYKFNVDNLFLVFFQNFFYAPFFAIVIVLIGCSTGWVGRFLQNPAFILLGNASYALYLFHWLPLGVTVYWLGIGNSSYIIVLPIMISIIIASIAIHLFLENPIRNYLLRISQ